MTKKRTMILLCLLLLMSTVAWVYCLVLFETGTVIRVTMALIVNSGALVLVAYVVHPPRPPWAEGFFSDPDLNTGTHQNYEVGLELTKIGKSIVTRLC